jgi:membrane-bound serine protease (ClpP class)
MRYIKHPRRLVLGLTLLVLGAIAAACGGSSEEAPGQVHVLTWDGIVNPVMERYIDRGIDTAERSDAVAVVIELDTPGGLDSSMRDIIQRMQASTVPVIVWVSPAGGRAASAGTFITMAAQVAAMAPNTTIGAASAINSDGSDIEGTLGKKIENDAVAYIRGIAEQRGRNADWAEDAVREAVAVNQTEAVELNVVDFIADNLTDLLAQSNGRVVDVPDENGAIGEETLAVTDAPIHENGTTFFEDLLYVIADPNIAFLLISLGGLAIIAEIFSTNGVTGIFGAIALILAFFSLGSLPVNWAGLALIAFGFTLIIAEIFVSGFGVLGIGGIIALAFGSIILLSGGSGPSGEGFLEVSRWLVISTAVAIGVITLGLIGVIVRSRKIPNDYGRESLVGSKGVTKEILNPHGQVWIKGEFWSATAEDPSLPADTPIIVTGTRGFHLFVKRDPASIPLLTAGTPPEDEEAPAVTSSTEG